MSVCGKHYWSGPVPEYVTEPRAPDTRMLWHVLNNHMHCALEAGHLGNHGPAVEKAREEVRDRKIKLYLDASPAPTESKPTGLVRHCNNCPGFMPLDCVDMFVNVPCIKCGTPTRWMQPTESKPGEARQPCYNPNHAHGWGDGDDCRDRTVNDWKPWPVKPAPTPEVGEPTRDQRLEAIVGPAMGSLMQRGLYAGVRVRIAREIARLEAERDDANARREQDVFNAFHDARHLRLMGGSQMYNTIKKLSVECDALTESLTTERAARERAERERDVERRRGDAIQVHREELLPRAERADAHERDLAAARKLAKEAVAMMRKAHSFTTNGENCDICIFLAGPAVAALDGETRE